MERKRRLRIMRVMAVPGATPRTDEIRTSIPRAFSSDRWAKFEGQSRATGVVLPARLLASSNTYRAAPEEGSGVQIIARVGMFIAHRMQGPAAIEYSPSALCVVRAHEGPPTLFGLRPE